jgi:hypothetical protein
MGVTQRGRNLMGDSQRVLQAELPLTRHPGAERLTVDVRHGVVGQPVSGARVEQRQDIGMLEMGGDLDFPKEALRTERLGQFGMQDLERDEPTMLQVEREVHGGHAPAPQLRFDDVLAGEGLVQAIELTHVERKIEPTP